MKKILHISNYLYPHIGGIEQVARDCMNSLKDEYEQKVICFNSDKKTIVDEVDGIEVTRPGSFIKVASQSLSLSYKKHLKRIMKRYQPDIVIFHYPNPFVGHFLCKYLKRKKFKFILWWHLDITKQKLLGKLFKRQNKKLLKYADRIVATSPNYIEGSRYLSENKSKCVVIPCCISENRLHYDETHLLRAKQIKEELQGKTLCFAFGRHVEYKGLTYLIKASKLLSEEFAIRIGGVGPLTDALKAEANQDNKIQFLGKLSDDELKAYLLACDIFCFPSITKNEAFGIGLAEAMYYGNPAITFNIPGSGVNFVSIKDVTGLEAKNGDAKDYADKIQQLASNSEIQNKFAQAAKQRTEEMFLYSTFVENVKKLVRELNI